MGDGAAASFLKLTPASLLGVECPYQPSKSPHSKPISFQRRACERCYYIRSFPAAEVFKVPSVPKLHVSPSSPKIKGRGNFLDEILGAGLTNAMCCNQRCQHQCKFDMQTHMPCFGIYKVQIFRRAILHNCVVCTYIHYRLEGCTCDYFISRKIEGGEL